MGRSEGSRNTEVKRPVQIPMPADSAESRKRREENERSRDGYGSIMKNMLRCRTGLSALESEYRKSLNSTLAELYGYAKELSENEKWWGDFCRDKFWQGKPPSALNRKNALRYVLRWACAASRESQKTASFYYRALRVLWEKKVAHSKVAKAIEEGKGLRQMAASKRHRDKQPKEKALSYGTFTDAVRSEEAKRDGWKKERKLGADKPFMGHTIMAKFSEELEGKWLAMKSEARFKLVARLDKMDGSAAHIVVEEIGTP